MFKKIDKRFASILCMNPIFIQSAIVVWNMNFNKTWVLFIEWCVLHKTTKCESII
jgi:hypothetical protein